MKPASCILYFLTILVGYTECASAQGYPYDQEYQSTIDAEELYINGMDHFNRPVIEEERPGYGTAGFGFSFATEAPSGYNIPDLQENDAPPPPDPPDVPVNRGISCLMVAGIALALKRLRHRH